MTPGAGSWQRRFLLPLSLGIADGIINALTLASAAVLHGSGHAAAALVAVIPYLAREAARHADSAWR